ncbi:unnamed protein product [Rotaria sp. Silwood2]|nr:unnamed protein product [Rotaria sp. Silwood2]CAF4351781.1 unnamed protein product [Rotaria sp. Silwood2]
MSIVQSCKGKDQLLLDGYRYRHTNKSLINWRCVKHNCNGSAMFDGAQYVKLNDHIHPPNPDEVIAAEFKSKIQQRATTSYDPPRRIIHEALLNVHKDDALALPSYAASQRLIGRKRKKNNISLPNPTCFQDIVIPDQLKLTNSGDRFLLYDNEDNDSRIIILSSDDDLKRLSQCDHWHADGTFRASNQLKKGALIIVQYIEFSIPSCHCSSNESVNIGKHLVPVLKIYILNLHTLRLW